MKVLKRQVIIREKEFVEKLQPQSHGLYDRVGWKPFSRQAMEQDNMWANLQGRTPPWDLTRAWNYSYYERFVTKGIPLYNDRYHQWRLWIEGDEYWIQPTNHNGKPSRLGIATVEKDL
jgi:hypothetical protein